MPRGWRCIVTRFAPRPTSSTLAVLDPQYRPLGRRIAAVPAQRHDGEQGPRSQPDRQSGAKRMISWLASQFRRTIVAAGSSEPARAVVALAGDAAAAAAHRISADAAVVRHRTKGRNPVADAVVADGFASRRRRARHFCGGRPDLEFRELVSPAPRAPLLILLDDGWSAASSWDARIKAADELIADADSAPRGVALVPLSEPARDITLTPAGTARVALRQLSPETLRHRAGRYPPGAGSLRQGDRRRPDRLAVGRCRLWSRQGFHHGPGQNHRRLNR